MLTFESLKNVQREEKKSNKPAKIDENFYSGVKQYLADKKEAYERARREDGDFAIHELELRNARMVVHDIYESRERKIIRAALNHARSEEYENSENLLAAEREMREAVQEVLEVYRGRLLHNMLEEWDHTEKIKKGKVEMVKVRFLQDFPAFVGVDSMDYGPFRAEENFSLPQANAAVLIKKGKAIGITEEKK